MDAVFDELAREDQLTPDAAGNTMAAQLEAMERNKR